MYSRVDCGLTITSKGRSAYTVHVDAVRVSSSVLVGLDEPCGQRLGDGVEQDELADAGEHLAVVLGALVDSQHHRRHVAEYRRTHQRCTQSAPMSIHSVTIQGGPAKVRPNLLVTFECVGKIQ